MRPHSVPGLRGRRLPNVVPHNNDLLQVRHCLAVLQHFEQHCSAFVTGNDEGELCVRPRSKSVWPSNTGETEIAALLLQNCQYYKLYLAAAGS